MNANCKGMIVMKCSELLRGAIAIGMGLVVGCGGPEEDATESGSGAQSRGTPAAPSAAQKQVDDRCFASYSQAASRCNDSSGDDDAAFGRCLEPVKAGLVSCCRSGGSPSCAEDASSSAEAQKQVDDQCFVAYSQAAGRCNDSSGDDDAKFTACLTPLKAELVSCCKNGGSPSCAEDASGSSADQKKVDDECFVAYSQEAGRCNTSSGEDEAAFARCLEPVKASLVECCKNGGSPACAEDAR
jgi:hypothetical protein